jgi:uncharacterized protein
MTSFDPTSALLGGALIGLASAMLMMLIGRIAGISGIVGGCLSLASGGKAWRFAFVAGLILAPLAGGLLGYSVPMPQMPASLAIVCGGVLIGLGTRLGGGCTSGHGVCGVARLSMRSILATALFMIAAMAVVAITRFGFGGLS